MKNYNILLILIVVSFNSMSAQTQLTAFDYQVPFIKYDHGGIVNVDSQDYFIENNSESIRVSRIVDNGAEVLYELSDFPIGDPPSIRFGRLENRSGYATDSIYLYEIFLGQIRKRNILSGEIEDVYLFPNEELKNITGMNIVDDIIHFTFWTGDSFGIYNITSQEFEFLPFPIACTYRDKNTYYAKTGEYGINAFNAQNGSSTLLFENERNISCGPNSIMNGQKGIVFGDFGQTRFFNADTTFLFDCDFADPIAFELNIIETDDYYISLSVFSETIFQIKDKTNCNNILSETFPDDHEDGSNLRIFNSSAFDEDYILFGVNYGDNFSIPKIMLFDKKEVTLSLISDSEIRFINNNSFYRINDELYFIGHPSSFDYSSLNLYSINLKTKQLKINQPDFGHFNPMSFAQSENDSTFLLAKISSNNIMTINRFYDFSNIQFIHAPSDNTNAGLNHIRYLAIDDEKMIFKFQNNIYLVDNYASSLNKVSLIAEAPIISNLALSDGSFEGLVNMDETSFHTIYNPNTNEIIYTPLDIYAPDITSSFAYSNYIFGSFSISQKLYFDTEIDNFIPIPISDEILTIHKSNNHILFLTSNETGYSMTSFIDDGFVNSELHFTDKPQIQSKNNGEFFLVENINNETQITVLKSDGTIADKIITSGKKLTVNQSNAENGPLSVFLYALYETEELEVIMHRNNGFYRYTIPFVADFRYPITWYKAGNSVIIKSESDSEPGIYICTIGQDPINLELNDVGFTNYKLLFATHNDGVVSFMIDTYLNNLEIVQYNPETQSLTKTDTEAEGLYYDWYGINNSIQISPYQYYVYFPYPDLEGDVENSELYLFDSQELTFELNSDLNQSFQYSNPHRFIESPSHLYFIARTSGDNSYQLFVKEKDEITSLSHEESNKSELKISPNPSSTFISLQLNADLLQIYNSQGIIVESIKVYQANEEISVSDLEIGVYTIKASVNSKSIISRFIKL